MKNRFIVAELLRPQKYRRSSSSGSSQQSVEVEVATTVRMRGLMRMTGQDESCRSSNIHLSLI